MTGEWPVALEDCSVALEDWPVEVHEVDASGLSAVDGRLGLGVHRVDDDLSVRDSTGSGSDEAVSGDNVLSGGRGLYILRVAV